jgi:hypothetical protein
MPSFKHSRGETRAFVFRREGKPSCYPHKDIWNNRYHKVRGRSYSLWAKIRTNRYERRVVKKTLIAIARESDVAK